MPKIAANGSATAYGQEGVVQGADGQLWELDPSRNLDGTTVDGYESDERDLSGAEERDLPTRPDDEPRAQPVDEPATEDEDAEPAENEEAKSSPGNSSQTSTAKPAKSASKR
jgi:hypothetical protein